MPTSRETKDKILTELAKFGIFSVRPMMGEYLLYLNGKHIGGIYDGNLLIKPTKSNIKLLSGAEFLIPYPGAKPMLLLSLCYDEGILLSFFEKTYIELPEAKRNN